MSKNIYLNISLGLLVFLTGLYIGEQTANFWIGKIIYFLSAVLSVFFIIGLELKNFRKRKIKKKE